MKKTEILKLKKTIEKVIKKEGVGNCNLVACVSPYFVNIQCIKETDGYCFYKIRLQKKDDVKTYYATYGGK
jgi:hypothetical protein